jgi:hypothetical protein
MKKILTPFLAVILFLSVIGMNAQSGKGTSSFIPYKSPNSVNYGTDIVLYNDITQDQRNVHVSVAFNGWLYAIYTHNDISTTTAGLTVLRSTDDGITWEILQDYVLTGAYTATDIVAAGNNLTDLKIFIAGIYMYTPTDWRVWCDRLDPVTGADESEILFENSTNTIYDVAIASDYRYPATGSTPYSLGIIYSKYGSPQDSVIHLTSIDGGMNIGSRNVVTATTNWCHKVAISYGVGLSKYDGRYFLAWEEFESSVATMGHIMAAYTDPWTYSPIINKIKLDSLDAFSTNLCSNPSIATQFNNVDNSASNISEVVLFDRFWSSGPDNDVIGYYNLQAAGTGIANWQRLNIAVSSDDEMQSDINFDPGYNNFLVTYYDGTTEKLPYIVNDMNLETPSTWILINNGYNDNPNLLNPFPKVEINPVVTKVAHVWNAEGSAVGVSMFDAEYSTYTGISQNHQSDAASLEGAYPNPASTRTNIRFTLNKPAEVTITLNSIFGQKLNVLTDNSFTSGKHTLDVDVSSLPAGTYIYTFTAGDFTASGRISVVR